MGEIATDIYRGNGIKREEITKTGIPCVRYGEIYTTYNIWFDECISHTTEEKIPNKKYFESGDILFAITGENIKDIAKSCAYIGNDKCLAGGDIVVMKHSQNPKYLAYALSSTNVQSQKSKGKVKSKVVHSSVPALKEISIPLPPLPVQEEIVRILDNMTSLTAELELRQKQYEHYRNSLLSFEGKGEQDGVRWMNLGEVASYSQDRIPATEINATTYVGVDNLLPNRQGKKIAESIPQNGNLTKFLQGDIMIGNIRPYLKKIWLADADGGTNGDVLDIRVNNTETILPRYLYFLLASDNFFAYDMQHSKGAKMPRGSKNAVMNYPIPVPSREEQQRIVDILDRFDKLCNDISEGLPAEIEARKKQYEYYRDKLLSFKEKEA